ncbi:hypothetical protein Pcinc_021380 [Petrolisthes cinctipes]|uniref:Uncharacterized protein n=1 Tax=Petrolisthes cinctipes TaxID=88211 RepID=A0AAE1FH56_PETCI|nr:hypothetical protein Pcinc_021380 [Petrolisthes cinctipes]
MLTVVLLSVVESVVTDTAFPHVLHWVTLGIIAVSVTITPDPSLYTTQVELRRKWQRVILACVPVKLDCLVPNLRLLASLQDPPLHPSTSTTTSLLMLSPHLHRTPPITSHHSLPPHPHTHPVTFHPRPPPPLHPPRIPLFAAHPNVKQTPHHTHNYLPLFPNFQPGYYYSRENSDESNGSSNSVY